eukprot:TRINITY_DN2167_c0_g1_i2.p1 TRINITY_DN2167_c0_g1~~TRINITY_DN2167_c0_g1_i2.p1  ORF type:complete len:646 (-),score=208.95 TRINITY_DN2167_c0_g1_i2:25-1962(-)
MNKLLIFYFKFQLKILPSMSPTRTEKRLFTTLSIPENLDLTRTFPFSKNYWKREHLSTLSTKKNFTPIHYAHLQDSKKMLKVFSEFGIDVDATMVPVRTQSVISVNAWPDLGIDPEQDSKELIKKSKATRVPKDPKPDPQSDLAPPVYEVLKTGDTWYDVLLTKTDVKYGTSGINNFYVMQIIYDKVKNLFILFNRWGRIGTCGQFQRTPYGEEEEAVSEFEKIFKSKTGNLWKDRGKFEKKAKKYRLVELDRTEVQLADLLKPFDLDTAKPTKLTKPVFDAMSILANVSHLQQAAKSSGIDTKMIPLGRLPLSVLIQAKEILQKIKLNIKAKDKPAEGGVIEPAKIIAIFDDLSDLSNRFYELIPHTGYDHTRIDAITDMQLLLEKSNLLTNLMDLGVASRILLGATHRLYLMNPIDYCYNALEIQLENIPRENPEFLTLHQYMNSTGGSAYNLKNIFRLQRKGEGERIAQWKSLDNHLLLWHGSGAANFMSILYGGLRIAPPEAPAHGYMFGKGLYFADVFAKSVEYCGQLNTTREGRAVNRGFILLCEVALGKMHEIKQGQYLKKAPEGYNSVKGLGARGPDMSKQLVLPNGVIIPQGEMIDYPVPEESKDIYGRFYQLGFNEYIVYDVSQVRMRYLLEFER